MTDPAAKPAGSIDPAASKRVTDALTKLLYETDGTAEMIIEMAPLYGLHITFDPEWGYPCERGCERGAAGTHWHPYWRDVARRLQASGDDEPYAEAALTRREPLDVAVLAQAIHAGERDMDPTDRPYCPACLADAQRYAAEYARLTEAER